MRQLGDLGGLVVADVGVERGDQHQGAGQQIVDPGLVRGDADGAVIVEALHAVCQQPHALQDVVGDHGPEHVQLEVAAGAADIDGHVVAHHLGAEHGERLALGRVDLAGHDGGAGFVLRDDELAEPAAGAARQPAHVVGDLHEGGRQRLEGAVGEDLGIARRQGLELVGGADERESRLLRQGPGHRLGKARRAVEAGADRGAAERQLAQMGQGGVQVALPLLQLGDPAGDLLPQGEGGGVLQVGAANLDDVVEGGGLAGQGLLQGGEGRQQPVRDGGDGRQVHGAREDIIAGLAPVHLVVGVHQARFPAGAAEQFAGPVGQHLVEVHVGLGAGAGLPDHQGELGVVQAAQDLVGGGHDGLGLAGGQQPQGVVDPGTGGLDAGQGMDDLHGLALPRDVEVVQGALGLGPPQPVRRDGYLPQAVPLHPDVHRVSPAVGVVIPSMNSNGGRGQLAHGYALLIMSKAYYIGGMP